MDERPITTKGFDMEEGEILRLFRFYALNRVLPLGCFAELTRFRQLAILTALHRWGAFLFVIALSAAYIALLMPLGFIPTTVLFLLGMVLYFDPSEMKVRVRNAVLYAVLFSVFLYLFFGKLLGVLLPAGILHGLLG